MTTLEYLLSQLAQECAEVIKDCTKAQHFGLHDTNAEKVAAGIPWPDNATLIAMEFDDLLAVMELLRAANWIPPSDPERIRAKQDKILKWAAYAKGRGTLNPSDGVGVENLYVQTRREEVK